MRTRHFVQAILSKVCLIGHLSTDSRARTLLAIVAAGVLSATMASAQSGREEPVIAVITVQETEGTSEADLDLAGLKRLETHLVQTTVERSRRNYARQGYDPRTFNAKVDSSSVFTTIGAKRLAIINMRMDAGVRAVWILGYQGEKFIRVQCFRASDHDIPVFSGECGTKVKEAFGVSLDARPSK